MTALLDRATPAPYPGSEPAIWTVGGPRLLAGLDGCTGALNLRAHLATHGPLPGADLDRLLAHLDVVGGSAGAIAGRGGAGYPLAAKLRALAGGPRRVIVNGTESEPASRKDRLLLRRSPHLVLDGAAATAAAVGARSVTVAVHDPVSADVVGRAIRERPDGGRMQVRVLDGGFVAGEARAVVRAVDGGPSLPPGRRTHATTAGTLVSNVETLAQLAVLLRMGPQRFADTGTAAEPGTTLLTLGGAVARPGVIELPLGTPLGIVLSAAGVVAQPQAVVVGGYHGSWLAPIPDLRLCHAGIASAGGSFGAGVLLVLGQDTCGLGELARVAGWLATESAKQCGPCRFGLPSLAADVATLTAGAAAAGAAAAGTAAVGAVFAHARAVQGRGACSHPDGTARFVTSGLRLLHDETDRHLAVGGCGRPVLGQLPIGGTP